MWPTQGPMDSTVRDIHRRVGRLTKLLEIVIVITVGMQFRVGFGGSRIACLQEARRSCTRHKIGLRLSYKSVCWWCGTSNRWVWSATSRQYDRMQNIKNIRRVLHRTRRTEIFLPYVGSDTEPNVIFLLYDQAFPYYFTKQDLEYWVLVLLNKCNLPFIQNKNRFWQF